MISRLHAALAAALVVMLILLAVVLIGGNKVLPWQTSAERQVDRYSDVQADATRSVLAFLDVDYQHMDARSKAVESLATGTFKKQYAATAVELKAAAQSAKAVSKGDVRYVGIRKVSAASATVLVAADVVVQNTATKGQKSTAACPHAGARCDKYRFVVTMSRAGDAWKMSDLEQAQ